jgi:2-hydroxymethylglutarate dehydrogenase
MNIGFIGIGNMGKPMSTNLLKAGYELVVYDVCREAMEESIRLGAKAAGNPSEVANFSDIVMTSLPTPEILEEVVLRRNGVLNGARRGCVLIDTSTVSPSTIKKIASFAKDRGVEVLDAPVSGGVAGANAGTLTVMVGGDEDVYKRCLGILRVIGKNVYYVGDVGQAML